MNSFLEKIVNKLLGKIPKRMTDYEN